MDEVWFGRKDVFSTVDDAQHTWMANPDRIVFSNNKQLDKSFSMVNAYACNRIQPNLETLQQIAEILQVDLKDLITDKKERLQ